MRRLATTYAHQLKFVVDQPDDLSEVEDFLASNPWVDRDRAMLMPQGTRVEQLTAVAQWLEPYCQRHDLHFCPRRQIEWFGLVRGT
jgi:hypothetical protein